MAISIFEVSGPVMTGPSSSHTAGAARLSRMAANVAGEGFTRVDFGLHGSFASTYKGHGTDLALVAGALGIREDDERIPDAFSIAAERGLEYSFHRVYLRNVGENSVRARFYYPDGSVSEIIGTSLGGGRICLKRIDGFDTELYCENPTLIIIHGDEKGTLGRITTVLAEEGLNIAVMRCTRVEKGYNGCTTVEFDDPVPQSIKKRIEEIPAVVSVRLLTLAQEDLL